MRRGVLIVALLLAGCNKPLSINPFDDNTSAPANVAATASASAGSGDSGASSDTSSMKPMTFTASDGLTIFARRYDAKQPKALILLFHQAESSKDEYATIAPRLVAAGYSALAIDARAGGSLFGVNETAAAFTDNVDNIEAQKDMQSALFWAGRQGLPVILWGSSYSAALAFPLTSLNKGKVRAILAFSPDEYFDDKTLVEQAAADVRVPVFITSASTPQEVAAARAIYAAVPAGFAEQYVPQIGVHGSATLIAAKDPKGAEANWRAVMAFLRKVAP